MDVSGKQLVIFKWILTYDCMSAWKNSSLYYKLFNHSLWNSCCVYGCITKSRCSLCSQKPSAAAGRLCDGLQPAFQNPGDGTADNAGGTVSALILPTLPSQALFSAQRHFIMAHGAWLWPETCIWVIYCNSLCNTEKYGGRRKGGGKALFGA